MIYKREEIFSSPSTCSTYKCTMNSSDDNNSSQTTALGAPKDEVRSIIHSDETQLRTLVVVLSLAGGLVLTFILGFGIYLCWHCRARRSHRLKKEDKHSCSSICSSSSSLPSKSHHPSGSSKEQNMNQVLQAVPSSFTSDALAPASAPPAKELDWDNHCNSSDIYVCSLHESLPPAYTASV